MGDAAAMTCQAVSSWWTGIFVLIGSMCILAVAGFLVVILSERDLNYRVSPSSLPLDSRGYQFALGLITGSSPLGSMGATELFTDGVAFYDAQAEAMRGATRSIHLEAYIFTQGEAARRLLEVMILRAKAGVDVRLVLDAVGSLGQADSLFNELRAVGGMVAWYHPASWQNIKRLNNRTHRNLLIIDGLIGFIGGAGVSDRWLRGTQGEPAWHDLVCRVEGPVVAGLQAAFAENWLEATSEIISQDTFLPALESFTAAQAPTALVVNSSPSAGKATRA